jgi:hypothetical protein
MMRSETKSERAPTWWHRCTQALTVGACLIARGAQPAQANSAGDFYDHLDHAEVMRHLVRRSQGSVDICVINVHRPASDADGDFAAAAKRNHQAYAERHGYKYFGFEGRLSGSRFINPDEGGINERLGGGWNWQKLAALAAVSELVGPERMPECRWMMWIDTDAIYSNPKIKIESIIGRFAGKGANAADVLLAREDAGYTGDFINSGVFLVKNSWGGRAFIEGSSQTYEKYKSRWLQDQDGIHDYVFYRDPFGLSLAERALVEAHTRPGITVTPQRAFDAFYWPNPPDHTLPSALWQPCDFVGHLAGATAFDRIEGMRNMTEFSKHC